MEHARFIGFLTLAAWLFALLEIQIEGRHGWAQNLPTWRIENKWTRTLYRKPHPLRPEPGALEPAP
ncbi:MAG: hypothetical protein MUC33_24470 [Desulfobacterales bacterium]|nr:hypothetical protein [Desulfobacterales bacterium]